MGNEAGKWSRMIGEQHYKITLKHPASAYYTKGIWDSEDIFNKINKILKEQINESIIW